MVRAGTVPNKPTIQQTNGLTCGAKRPSTLQPFNPLTLQPFNQKKRAQESKGMHPSTLELLNSFTKKPSSPLAFWVLAVRLLVVRQEFLQTDISQGMFEKRVNGA